MKKFLFVFATVVAILAMMAFPALAENEAHCVFNAQHGWHIVGGGQQNDHWFETEDECLAALEPTTPTPPTDVPTEEPTEVPTEVPTDIPTDIPTDEPTVTPDPTETVLPTLEAYFPVQTPERPSGSCQKAWNKISGNVHKDVGYRYFETHTWCKSWLLLKKGINYNHYRLTHP